MPVVIKVKKSETALSKPTASDIAVGEIALNAKTNEFLSVMPMEILLLLEKPEEFVMKVLRLLLQSQ